MRDHYYQLWDLEKNFGEKTLCDDTLSEKMNPNKALELTLMSSFMDRGFFGDGTGAKKPAEKPTDRWGFGTGVESTPFGINVNDCCILNLDEKTLPNDTRKKRSVEKIRSKRSSSRQVYNCGQMRVKLKGVEKKTAGWCKPNPAFKRQGIIKLMNFENYFYTFFHKNFISIFVENLKLYRNFGNLAENFATIF